MGNVLMEEESPSMGGAEQVLNLKWEFKFTHWLKVTGAGQPRTDFQHLTQLFCTVAQQAHKLKKTLN